MCSRGGSRKPAAIPSRSGKRTTGTGLPPIISRGWIEDVGEGIAHALVSAVSVVDFQAAIIDGAMPPAIRGRIVAKVAERFARLERKGLPELDIVEGTIGYRARAIGGASLPFLAKFMRDREVLFREPEEGTAPDAGVSMPDVLRHSEGSKA